MYKIRFAEGWDRHYHKMDKPSKERIWKKTQQLKFLGRARHLRHGVPYFVVETGQDRICFEQAGNARTIIFAGNHKQYEEWCARQ